MGQSQSLRLADVRKVFRVLGDVCDLRHDQPAQEQRIVDGLVEVVGAPFGWAAQFEDFRPGRDTAVSRFVLGSVTDEHTLDWLWKWSEVNELADDPMVHLGRPSAKPADLVCRSERLSEDEWRAYGAYEGVAEPSGLRDNIALWFRYPGADRIRGYALWRMQGDRLFTPRQTRMARLFAEELALLYEQGRLEPPGVFDTLPDRLRRLVPLLLTGLGQKQIATQTGLSYHTVRSYVKELYGMLAVSSREELSALARGENRNGGN